LAKKLAMDQDEIKRYFPVSHVVPAVLGIYSELLTLQFVSEEGAESWHPDVEKFRVEDALSHEVLGHLYLDLHPRPSKYSTLRSRAERKS
jgi:Zn-dependent oligopeptidase